MVLELNCHIDQITNFLIKLMSLSTDPQLEKRILINAGMLYDLSAKP